MNKKLMFVAVSGALLTVGTAITFSLATAKPMANDEIVKQIEKLEIAAVEARTFEDLQRLYSPDVVDFSVSHFMIGFNKLVSSFGVLTPQVDNWVVPIVPGSLHITATSEMAVASSLQVWNADYKEDGKPAMQMFYRQTDVWLKQPNGTWQIIAAHSSIPIDPITERPLCVAPNGYCPLPNYPRRGMNVAGIIELNKSYGPVFQKIAEAKAKSGKSN